MTKTLYKITENLYNNDIKPLFKEIKNATQSSKPSVQPQNH